MYVYSVYGKAKWVKTLKKDMGYEFQVSLGLEKGFMTITYFTKGKKDAIVVKDGMSIFIPKGDLSVSTFVKEDGSKVKNAKLTTNWLEETIANVSRVTADQIENGNYEERIKTPSQPVIKESNILSDDNEPWELDL